MTYVISGLGRAPSISMGTGSSTDPFGGIAGATESELKDLIASGAKLTLYRVETGAFNGEKYLLTTRSSTGKWYKWYMTGSGLMSGHTDDDARQWFNDIVRNATQKTNITVKAGDVTVVVPPTKVGQPGSGGTRTPGLTFPGTRGGLSTPSAGSGGGGGGGTAPGGETGENDTTTKVVLVAGLALAALFFLKR